MHAKSEKSDHSVSHLHATMSSEGAICTSAMPACQMSQMCLVATWQLGSHVVGQRAVHAVST